MRCLTRMGLGLVGLALVTPPVAFADPPYPLPDVAYLPPERSVFDGMHLCARCQRTELEARGIAVPPPPVNQVDGLVPTNQACDRCGGPVSMMAASPAAAARLAAQAPRAAAAFTSVPLSAPPAVPALASSPPIVPGPSAGPAWASVPATASSLTVASLAAPAATPAPAPAPAPGPALLATNRTRPLAPIPASGPALASVATAPAPLTARPRTRVWGRARAAAPSSMASTASPANSCPTCEASAATAVAGGASAGRAVAGGGATGYAVIGGTMPLAEPTPIGVIQGRYAYQDQGPAIGAAGALPPGGRAGAGANPRSPGSSDPAVMPSGFNTEPYDPVGHNRPHIISHVFGLDAIGRHSREVKERREREKHASIPYRALSEQPAVEDLPSKMVYGK